MNVGSTTWMDSDVKISHSRRHITQRDHNEDALNWHTRHLPGRLGSLWTFDGKMYVGWWRYDKNARDRAFTLTMLNVFYFAMNFQKGTDRSFDEITWNLEKEAKTGIERKRLTTSRLISRLFQTLSMSAAKYEILCSIDVGAAPWQFFLVTLRNYARRTSSDKNASVGGGWWRNEARRRRAGTDS